jgi:hypothetical protein
MSFKHYFWGCKWEKWSDPQPGEKFPLRAGFPLRGEPTIHIMLQERRCTICNKRELREAN